MAISTLPKLLAIVLLGLTASGCVERILAVRSDPSDAMVFVNGKLAGTTPLDHPFDFYGTFDIVVRRAGCLSERVELTASAPRFEVFPLDLISDVLVPWPLRDEHSLTVELRLLPETYDPELLRDLRARADTERDRARAEAAAARVE